MSANSILPRATRCRYRPIQGASIASTTAATRCAPEDWTMYLQKFKLDGRTAVVTGGGQGIGLACVEALAEAGARVIIADRDIKAAETAREEMARKGYATDIVGMDVTDSRRVTEVADQLTSWFGKVDILVNNAGIARSETPAETVTDEHWLNVIDVNLNGTFWCCRAFGKHMLGKQSGTIVN